MNVPLLRDVGDVLEQLSSLADGRRHLREAAHVPPDDIELLPWNPARLKDGDVERPLGLADGARLLRLALLFLIELIEVLSVSPYDTSEPSRAPGAARR